MFCTFAHSIRLPSSGVSSPMNTFLNPAATSRSSNSGSSTRFSDASVMNGTRTFRRARQAMSARSSSFTFGLCPMKLSSTMKIVPPQPVSINASSSAIIWAGVFARGTRPYTATMSQNSQSNGQPRENCTDMVA